MPFSLMIGNNICRLLLFHTFLVSFFQFTLAVMVDGDGCNVCVCVCVFFNVLMQFDIKCSSVAFSHLVQKCLRSHSVSDHNNSLHRRHVNVCRCVSCVEQVSRS